MLDISSPTANVCDQHAALLHPHECSISLLSGEETLVPANPPPLHAAKGCRIMRYLDSLSNGISIFMIH
jgi:hypothetical protein